ncbi:MAG: LuxR C-terminal-related transcriptional regulator [Hyphomicrobium sp.]|nr:LuxR C-terminal-related transcriptional regulator [Hyphomicrobium sp.]
MTNDLREAMIGGIYDVAVDPSRLEELVTIWSDMFDGARGPLNFASPELVTHVERAAAILEKSQSLPSDTSKSPAQWTTAFRNAAFVVNGIGLVVASNEAAARKLQISPGSSLDALPLESEDVERLHTYLSAPQRARANNATLLMRSRSSDATVVLQITPTLNGHKDLTGVSTSFHVWPENLSALLASAFNLTVSETEVLKDLTFGYPVKEIAARRNRLETTVRTQVRRLLERTSTRNQVELVRMTMVLMDLAHTVDDNKPKPGTARRAAKQRDRSGLAETCSLKVGQGRKLEYLSIGAPDGDAFVMLPTDGGFTRLTESAETWISRQHLKMIVPIRAGYGNSDFAPAGENALRVLVEDIIAIADSLGIARCPILAFTDDFHTAVELAATEPNRFTAIVGVGAVMPASEPRHLKRMPAWTRFVIHNARFAPRTMPFVGLAIIGFVRSLGPRHFLESALGSSPADIQALQDVEVQAALLRGDNVALQSKSFHRAWAAWAVANYGEDWQHKLLACKVPITLFAGVQDPFSPIETVREFAERKPDLKLIEYADCGQLLYRHWPEFLGEIRQALLAEPC